MSRTGGGGGIGYTGRGVVGLAGGLDELGLSSLACGEPAHLGARRASVRHECQRCPNVFTTAAPILANMSCERQRHPPI